MPANKIDALEYFIGGVPAGAFFKMNLDDVSKMVDSSQEGISRLNPVAEVCLIGLVSYFEAFCKNHFAAIINICPQVLKAFCSKRQDIAVQVEDLLSLEFRITGKLGFILAEKFDFGSARNINSLYMDLLTITPFSKAEITKYNRLLMDRNLLVHHAGVYTMKYHKQPFKQQSVKNRLFFDSLIVRRVDFLEWAKFIDGVAVKIVNASHQKLNAFIKTEGLRLSSENRKALGYLKWYK